MKKKERQDSMDIEKYNELNLLKEKRNNLISEQMKLNKRPLLGKQIGCYVIGLYGITIISSLVFGNITLLSGIIPTAFALTSPFIMKNRNKKNSNKLETEINHLNNQINRIEIDLNRKYQNNNLENDKENVSNTIEELEETCKQNDGPKLVKSLFIKKY